MVSVVACGFSRRLGIWSWIVDCVLIPPVYSFQERWLLTVWGSLREMEISRPRFLLVAYVPGECPESVNLPVREGPQMRNWRNYFCYLG